MSSLKAYKANAFSVQYRKMCFKTRFSILRRKSLCFICFKGGHLSVNCSNFKDYKCEKCSAKHNISACSRQAIPVATPVEELQNRSQLGSDTFKHLCSI